MVIGKNKIKIVNENNNKEKIIEINYSNLNKEIIIEKLEDSDLKLEDGLYSIHFNFDEFTIYFPFVTTTCENNNENKLNIVPETKEEIMKLYPEYIKVETNCNLNSKVPGINQRVLISGYYKLRNILNNLPEYEKKFDLNNTEIVRVNDGVQIEEEPILWFDNKGRCIIGNNLSSGLKLYNSYYAIYDNNLLDNQKIDKNYIFHHFINNGYHEEIITIKPKQKITKELPSINNNLRDLNSIKSRKIYTKIINLNNINYSNIDIHSRHLIEQYIKNYIKNGFLHYNKNNIKIKTKLFLPNDFNNNLLESDTLSTDTLSTDTLFIEIKIYIDPFVKTEHYDEYMNIIIEDINNKLNNYIETKIINNTNFFTGLLDLKNPKRNINILNTSETDYNNLILSENSEMVNSIVGINEPLYKLFDIDNKFYFSYKCSDNQYYVFNLKHCIK
jgi:hypothetical protein